MVYKLDFVEPVVVTTKNVMTEVKPQFIFDDIKDIVIHNDDLVAFWTGERWSSNPNDLTKAIDAITMEKVNELKKAGQAAVYPVLMRYRANNGLDAVYQKFLKGAYTPRVAFDNNVRFDEEDIKREDHATFTLPYHPEKGEPKAWNGLLDVLYDPDQKERIEWFVGAVATNAMSHNNIQKFMYLYGGKGTGKSTVINIIADLFTGYTDSIRIKELTGGGQFASQQVRDIPILIDSETKMSSIKDDTLLLKLTSHESLPVERKRKDPFNLVFNGLLICASNDVFAATKESGITRRAVVIKPTNNRVSRDQYDKYMKQMPFERPQIINQCIDIFKSLGPKAMDEVNNEEFVGYFDLMHNFIEERGDSLPDPIRLADFVKRFKLYLEGEDLPIRGISGYCKKRLPEFYRNHYTSRRMPGFQYPVKNVYEDLLPLDGSVGVVKDTNIDSIENPGDLIFTESKFDLFAKEYKAQYANEEGYPIKKWDQVDTKLSDVNTTELHYVMMPENHIVLDFDLKDENGNKSRELNLESIKDYPPTYAEFSKGGSGVHLHYIYDGDTNNLASEVKENIEIKVFKGKTSLRRRLTYCNALDVAHISTGLPKKEFSMYKNTDTMVWDEAKMRSAVKRAILKQHHGATKPEIDFIAKVFHDAEESGVKYNLTDMKRDLITFAAQSTNQSNAALKIVNAINYSTIKEDFFDEEIVQKKVYPDEELYFFDLEVYPNLLLVTWKKYGEHGVHTEYNPSAEWATWFVKHPIVAFNNLRYDNHILYGAMVGETNEELFNRSQGLINNVRDATNWRAYDLSYLDIYEMASKKQSLKKWEIELGLKHDEFEGEWDKPLPEADWPRAAEYCGNDTMAAEEVFKARRADYEARIIISELSGLSVNSKTQKQAAAFLFGKDNRHPQDEFVYSDLSKEFPGYKFEAGKSSYMGEDPSEGGYVYANPGVYENVGEFDIASMHPTSLIMLDYFGPYTKRFADLKQARIYIKHGELDKAGEMFDGALKPYLKDEENASALAYALKIVINIVYGMTSAKFDNEFKEPHNVDNIVAKRGALFMINLKHVVQDAGYNVVHIKTDSIKVSNADEKIKKIIFDYGQQYGYTFELEHVFDIMALVNKAVLIGHVEDSKEWGKEANRWEAIGAQFADPYVYKMLFTKEEVKPEDFAVTKQVNGSIFLGNTFIGKVGQFYASKSGQEMFRRGLDKDGEYKFTSVTGTKDFKWRLFTEYSGIEDIDMSYYDGLVDDAVGNITDVAENKELVKKILK